MSLSGVFGRWGVRVLALAGVLGGGAARADDGGITYGGAPRLLAGHPSVSMQSEVVRMKVGRKRVRVTCDFVFHNSGRAGRVRMGFPDRGEGDGDPGRSDPKEAPKGTFLSYASWVDGKGVPTRIVRSSDSSQVWHAKTVSFAAGATRRVRDVYTLEAGGMGRAAARICRRFTSCTRGRRGGGRLGGDSGDV